ncbi:LOW QUALITY PROTEIN: transcription elongation regulator 1-like protein [Panthera uncia]|uniref:LOW QUALITY PROTEIN: transcription elongation regulator 1-like protein n=1 Tax=Panthera uncia TaxID=29064 RepID=UPI0020FFA8F6|nr:LOW QUALITY PROTEIN: transcription elongation regulator 1-like protein [Panthera uncia]
MSGALASAGALIDTRRVAGTACLLFREDAEANQLAFIYSATHQRFKPHFVFGAHTLLHTRACAARPRGLLHARACVPGLTRASNVLEAGCAFCSHTGRLVRVSHGGGPDSLKPVGSSPAIAIAAAAVLSVEPEGLGGPSPPSTQPCHFLTLAPIKIPLRTTPFSDKSRERGRAPCPPGLMLHADRKSRAGDGEDKEPPSILVTREDSAAKGNRPVASTPVPGSPWCVVWTGDDRVFFFNPTMQLSVWEKPMDLKNRGDLNRIIEDPPHKRKLEAPTADHSDGSRSEDGREDRNMRTKRNRTEGHASPGPEEAEGADKDTKTPPPQILLPLEERVTHFRDMLLERGVSAFSTWEKELHKIVFDPRYLLLNSEERKQIFEQFVKTRIKEEYKEKKNKLLLAKEEFKKLLEESKVSPRTTFKEFAEKYGRDQRFRLVQRKKDQEHFFNQFILILKKRDKENRLRLRKMR